MTAASGLHIVSAGGYGVYMSAAYKCPNCLRLSVASEWRNDMSSGNAVYEHSAAADEATWRDPKWLPRYAEVKEFPDVPQHIASAASEATLCLSVGAYRAVGALARAVVEATAKDKEAAGGNLAARIDALHAASHVRTHTKEQAHEIRHFGNDMAHGDFVDEVAKEDAEEVIGLMVEVLDEVYQSPARLQRRREARLERRERAEEG